MSATENEQQQDHTLPETQVYRQSSPDLLIFRDEDEPVVEGRIVPYEQWSEVDSIIEGHFMERFARGSFTKTLLERVNEMRVYFEHGRSRLFDSQPIAVLREAWEQPDGLYFRAGLLDGLPELFLNGLRRGLYGASIGAKVLKIDRNRWPEKSPHNPEGIEERTYRELRASDFSITPKPHYAGTLALRSITDDLVIDKLLEDPKRLLEVIARTQTEQTTEPPHSEPEEPQEQAPAESRSTQPPHDYLRDEEDDQSWRL